MMKTLLLPSFKLLILLIAILVGLAFLTLLERKILGLAQTRKGPSKTSFLGILQPLADVIKLFSKNSSVHTLTTKTTFFLSPLLSASLAMMAWLSCPLTAGATDPSLSLLFFLCCLSISVYPILMASWTSNSKYPMMGCYRSLAQTISYEISLALTLLSILLFHSSLETSMEPLNQSPGGITKYMPPLILLWVLCILAETSRTPFDFAEGESELVSGFNTEYGGVLFSLFFVAEYCSILFMATFTSLMFMASNPSTALFWVTMTVTAMLIIWLRATLPRSRYDKLMDLAWKKILPLSLVLLTTILLMTTTTAMTLLFFTQLFEWYPNKALNRVKMSST